MDSPQIGIGSSSGGADVYPQRDEGTPEADAEGSSADTAWAAHTVSEWTGDEGHALTHETDTLPALQGETPAHQVGSASDLTSGKSTEDSAAQADRATGWREKARAILGVAVASIATAGTDVLPALPVISSDAVRIAQATKHGEDRATTVYVVGTQVLEASFDAAGEVASRISPEMSKPASLTSPTISTLEVTSLSSDIAGRIISEIAGEAHEDLIAGEAHEDLNVPGTGCGTVEHPVSEPGPDSPSYGRPDETDSALSDELMELLDEQGKRDDERAKSDEAALERGPSPERFPRIKNSPNSGDQVQDRRPPRGR